MNSEDREALSRSGALFDGVVDLDSTVRVESRPLAAYRNLSLIRAHSGWEPSSLVFYFLRDPGGEFLRLDGSFPVVGQLNKSGLLALDDASVEDYLWFYTFFLRDDANDALPLVLAHQGEGGLFPEASDYSAEIGRRLRRLPQHIECHSETDTGIWHCRASVAHEANVHTAIFGVSPDGRVTVISVAPEPIPLGRVISAPISASHVKGDVKQKRHPHNSGNSSASKAWSF